jgi:hypothetical protein
MNTRELASAMRFSPLARRHRPAKTPVPMAAWAAVISALLLGVAGTPRVEAAEPVVVVFLGDPVPDGNGTFTFLDNAVINDAGQVAFRGSLAGTTGGGNDNRGIFRQ